MYRRLVFILGIVGILFVGGCGNIEPEKVEEQPPLPVIVVDEVLDDDKELVENEIVAEELVENETSDEEEVEDDVVEDDTASDDEGVLENDIEKDSKKEGDFYISELDDDIKARITGISYPGTEGMAVSYSDLRYLHILYNDFNGNSVQGELICNKKIADDLLDIFMRLYEAGYQLDKVRLIDEYGGDDDASCADDNTSCFNYRIVTGGSKLSNHAYGMAIDVNPYYNPYVKYKNGQPSVLLPATAAYIDRSADFPHKIDENDLCYKLFAEHGFKWGGYYKNVKDYQHFEKN